MTDRITAYLVTLDEPIREDDAEPTLAAIRQIKGVASVKPVVSDNIAVQAAIARRDTAWMREIGNAIRATTGPRKDNDHE